MDTALSRTRDASTGLVGTLRVGYTKGYERSDLSNKLRAFHLEYPNVLITCHRCDTDVLAAGLLNGEYDIIFTWDSTNIRAEEVEAGSWSRFPWWLHYTRGTLWPGGPPCGGRN